MSATAFCFLLFCVVLLVVFVSLLITLPRRGGHMPVTSHCDLCCVCVIVCPVGIILFRCLVLLFCLQALICFLPFFFPFFPTEATLACGWTAICTTAAPTPARPLAIRRCPARRTLSSSPLRAGDLSETEMKENYDFLFPLLPFSSSN